MQFRCESSDEIGISVNEKTTPIAQDACARSDYKKGDFFNPSGAIKTVRDHF